MKRFSILCLLLGLAVQGLAYTRITSSSSGVSVRWASMPISYFISQQGSSQIQNDSEFAAVQAAFQTWQNVSTADVRFNYLGTTSQSAGAGDSVNLISFSDSSFPWSSGTLAVTLSYFSSSTGITSEADILFNPNQSWTTSGEPSRYDIQSVLTHEIGHFLGLDHSGIVSSVMSPFGFPGQVDQRTLMYDDIAGISEIYPAGSPSVGNLSGTVKSGTQPIKGAHVVAVNSNGTTLVSTITATDGSYTLRFLPGGNYRIYAEPLDGPVVEGNLGGYYSNLNTNFGTTYYGSASTYSSASTVFAVVGQTTAVNTIQVAPRSSSGLNITRPTFAPRIPRGASGTLTVQGFDLSSGTVYSARSSADVLLGSPTFGASGSSAAPTSAALPLTAGGSAVLGPRDIEVSRGSDTAVGAGIIVLTDSQPSGVSFNPSTGPSSGGTRVTVTGSNFRSGARVYFGGNLSTDARFINSSTLDVLLPSNLPGSALVLVVNSDGTGGVSSSNFVFETAPPTISNVSPLSGPPATEVTIDGTNFDPFNSLVSFNGLSARVSSATATRIVTAVPYGATTGPVVVTAYGSSVSGPVFNVTAATPSSNVAQDSYVFTDASVSAGGTALSFASNDDGSASVALPFTFSLFRDIYPAGSQITVTTNGYISLEAGAAAEFQNGLLPGATAQKPAAVGCFTQTSETRLLPRSLIAPFFDDLTAVAGVSSITTRVVGSAPNRRLIVQWSRMTILDESGCDLHTTLTFQAVLFEGSNDIQYFYDTMTGPRSDGTSATIGMQDYSRTFAVLTGYNQAKARSGAYVTYRFSNGNYTATMSDSTPPTTPVVQDGGTETNSTTTLSASWSASDPDSGIREYQYAIGTTAGATNVLAYTATTNNYAAPTGLALSPGATYYFAVRAVNNEGLVSAVGVSDGIVVNPSLTFSSKAIPFVQHNSQRYTGIALVAQSATSVTLNAFSNAGLLIATTTVSLNPGQQYSRLISEYFNLNAFEGWIEVIPSAPGLGVFAATGSRDNKDLDGSVPRELLTEFIALHSGATLWMVNPSSTQAASVTITPFSGSATTLSIPARGRVSTTLFAAARVTSTQPLSSIEVIEGPGRLAMFVPEAPSGAMSLTFPHGVLGGGYSTSLILANVGATTNATVQFRGASAVVPVSGNSTVVVSLSSLFPVPASGPEADAVRVTASPSLFGSPNLVGAVDIANPLNLVSMGTRPAAMEFRFPQVAQGGDFFTGLVFVTGNEGAFITLDVYTPGGDGLLTTQFGLMPNQQLARLLPEILSSITTQLGGYIRIRSDQPILAWEVFGTDEAFASGPPL